MAPSLSPSRQASHVGDGAGHCRRRRGEGTGEKCPATLALTSLEVAIAGAHRALAGRELVAVHRDAHRATSFSPFSAGFHKNTIEPLGFCLTLDVARAWNDQH